VSEAEAIGKMNASYRDITVSTWRSNNAYVISLIFQFRPAGTGEGFCPLKLQALLHRRRSQKWMNC
jgi:hypothetical protein